MQLKLSYRNDISIIIEKMVFTDSNYYVYQIQDTPQLQLRSATGLLDLDIDGIGTGKTLEGLHIQLR